jgi:prolyl-tRNA synthetase
VIADTGEDAIVYCPTSDYAANMELAEALALGAARRRAQALTKTPRRARAPARTWPRCWAAAGADRQVAGAGHRRAGRARRRREARSGCCCCAATTSSTRSRPARSPASRAASASRPWPRSRRTSAASRATWAHRPEEAGQDRGRPHGGPMADFVCGANEADFHYTGVNWGRDLPEPDWWPTCATWSPATLAGRQGRAGDPARHRSGPRVLAGHQVLRRDERHLPGRERQAQLWRWAATASA